MAGSNGQLVATIIHLIICMALHPMVMHFMPGYKKQEPLPEIHVMRRLFVTLDPALFLPAVDPAFGKSVDDIFAVAVKLHDARLLQQKERLDDTGELHTVVGGIRFATGCRLFNAIAAEDTGPATGAGITAAGAICVDRDSFHSNSYSPAEPASVMEVAEASNIPGLIEGKDQEKYWAKKNQTYGEPVTFVKDLGQFHRRNNADNKIHYWNKHQQKIPAVKPSDLEEYVQVIYRNQRFPARLCSLLKYHPDRNDG